MLAQVNVKVRLNAMPRATYFAKIQKFDTSFYMLGWGVPTFDSLYSLQSLLRTVGQGGDGNFNLGKYSQPQGRRRRRRAEDRDRPVKKRKALTKEGAMRSTRRTWATSRCTTR